MLDSFFMMSSIERPQPTRLPSIPIQQEIIKKYFDAKDGANNYYAKADECKTNALINFEKEIF